MLVLCVLLEDLWLCTSLCVARHEHHAHAYYAVFVDSWLMKHMNTGQEEEGGRG